MAENLLNKVLAGVIKTETVIQWLLGSDCESDGTSAEFPCNKGEFISHFLNTLHEEALRIDNAEFQKQPSNRKRQSLFSEDSSDIKIALNKSQTFPPLSSTPKLSKTASEELLHDSPVSPIVHPHSNNSSNSSFSTPRTRSMCLGDFIVHSRIRSSNKKKKSDNETEKRPKRINPTSLEQINSSFRKCENSFDFNQEVREVSADFLRNVSVEDRLKIVSRNVNVTPQKPRSFCRDRFEIAPDVCGVTERGSLDVFVEVYVAILRGNLALNLSSELHFLVSLLLSKQWENDDEMSGVCSLNEDRPKRVSDLFASVHNVVYFSVKMIEQLLDVVQILDKTTMKLLADHKNISAFSPSLQRKLSQICDRKTETVHEIHDNNFDINVCFISDTDNRENFPNDQSFCAFRKQRDLFYEILRIWEQNHQQPGWSFSIALGAKIRSLLNMHHEGVNFAHLARLFKNQLLCAQQNDSDELSFLSSIPNVDVDKLNRLKTRLVTKQTSNGINSSPAFTGYQEFYRDFLLVASSHIFIQNVKDVLISDIIQLNDTSFTSDSNSEIDEATRRSFCYCLKCLRVLAKFLGFLEALPYRIDSAPSEAIVGSLAKIRGKSQANLDLTAAITNAVSRKTLTLTIPWVTKYLSMLDYVTLRLPYYLSLFERLFCIYRNLRMDTENVEATLLIKLCLGWLFELPSFPGNLYYTFNAPSEPVKLSEPRLVDQNVIAICCPYLKEIRSLLTNSSSKEGVTFRHITPLTTLQSPAKVAKKRVEIRLEEAFFNGQPVSVKKTVEFVAERVASACVKHICGAIVPPFKKQALEDWRKFLENEKLTEDKLRLKRKSNDFATDHLHRLLKLCREEIKSIVKQRVPTSIENLLSLDVLPQTKSVCTSIARRVCFERTEEWMGSHVVLGVFTKDLESEINRCLNNTMKKPKEKSVFMLPFGGRNVAHNEETLSAVSLLGRIRETCIDVLEKSTSVDVINIKALLEDCLRTIKERCDVNDSILSQINTILLDLFLLLASHNSSVVSQKNIQMQFLEVWKTYPRDKENLFKSLICPRNVMLLAQSNDPAQAWDILAKFSAFLLREKMTTCENFETQCVGLFRNDWDQNTLKSITGYFEAFLKYYSDYGGSSGKFTLLVEFLAEFCCDFETDF